MELAINQNVSEKKTQEEKSEWTFRRLFPMKVMTAQFTKNISNIFDIILSYLILVMTISMLINLEISWMFYVLIFLVLVADVVERQKVPIIKEEKKSKS